MFKELILLFNIFQTQVETEMGFYRITPIEKPVRNFDKKEIDCLARNIYYEARGEPEIEQMATSQVVLNRVNDKNFPDSICAVVYQPYQFSWTSKPYRITDWKSYNLARRIAKEMYYGNISFEYIGNANHYHRKDISPNWSSKGKDKKYLISHVYMEL